TLTWAQLKALGIDDDGTYSNIRVEVADGHGHVVTSSAATLVVNNTAPALTLSGAATTNKTAVYTLSLASSDPGNDTISSWTINRGAGAEPQVVSGNPSSVTHVFSTPAASRTISATATDEDGTYSAGNTVSVAVTNIATPVLTISGNTSVNEGATYTLLLS